MVIKPKVRGFICTNAHPVGCAQSVKNQIDYVKKHDGVGVTGAKGPKNVLVIGSSTGYGLASRITAAFGYGANTYRRLICSVGAMHFSIFPVKHIAPWCALKKHLVNVKLVLQGGIILLRFMNRLNKQICMHIPLMEMHFLMK